MLVRSTPHFSKSHRQTQAGTTAGQRRTSRVPTHCGNLDKKLAGSHRTPRLNLLPWPAARVRSEPTVVPYRWPRPVTVAPTDKRTFSQWKVTFIASFSSGTCCLRPCCLSNIRLWFRFYQMLFLIDSSARTSRFSVISNNPASVQMISRMNPEGNDTGQDEWRGRSRSAKGWEPLSYGLRCLSTLISGCTHLHDLEPTDEAHALTDDNARK